MNGAGLFAVSDRDLLGFLVHRDFGIGSSVICGKD